METNNPKISRYWASRSHGRGKGSILMYLDTGNEATSRSGIAVKQGFNLCTIYSLLEKTFKS